MEHTHCINLMTITYYSVESPKKDEGTRILGTGIAIRTRYPIMRSACPNDRTTCICTRFSNTPIAIISAYGLTEINSDIDAKQKFYNVLKNLLASVPKEYQNNVVILGDFNARIGVYSEDSNNAIRGKYGGDPVNVNDIELMTFCQNMNMVIANTYFYRQHYGTWKHTNVHAKISWYQIDHVTTKTQDKIKILDCGNGVWMGRP